MPPTPLRRISNKKKVWSQLVYLNGGSGKPKHK